MRTEWHGAVKAALPRPGRDGSIADAGQPRMQQFTLLDLIGLACFVAAWIGYAVAMEWLPRGTGGLNARMDRYREVWLRRMLARDLRMVDTQIMASLQSGTAFFASTSLIAISAGSSAPSSSS
jgi:uncharacterized membrane protein